MKLSVRLYTHSVVDAFCIYVTHVPFDASMYEFYIVQSYESVTYFCFYKTSDRTSVSETVFTIYHFLTCDYF